MMDETSPAACLEISICFIILLIFEVTFDFNHTRLVTHTPRTPLLHLQYYCSLMTSKD